MAKIHVIRKTLAGQEEAFHFDVNSAKFLVKNLSDSDAYVAFEEGQNTDNMICVPSQIAQICLINENLPEPGRNVLGNAADTVYVTGTGVVEVQAIWLI